MDTTIEQELDNGIVVVAYMDDTSIPTKGSINNHHCQGRNVFDLLQEDCMWLEINQWIFDAEEVPVVGFIVSGRSSRMDPDKAKNIVK